MRIRPSTDTLDSVVQLIFNDPGKFQPLAFFSVCLKFSLRFKIFQTFRNLCTAYFIQRSHNLRKFPQIFAVSMGVVLGITYRVFYPALSQSEEISSDFCCFYGGGIRHNEDIMHSFQNFIVKLIPNHPPPLETRIWKLVVRALILSCFLKSK